MLYDHLKTNQNKKKQVILLIDPDKHNGSSLFTLLDKAVLGGISLILIGGSLTSKSINENILLIKQHCNLPVFLFPGSLMQLCDHADGIFLLSLLSGRNADFLIGNHVQAAPFLRRSKLEIIPTGYILIDCGQPTSVEYMSNTFPIPFNKPDIAVATAMAGEMLGLKLIYLEGGSGADKIIHTSLISEVKSNISLPLIVGGGIRTYKQAKDIFNAGADLIVIGTAAEENPDSIIEIAAASK
jgi:phosphoglycerol geranylgeranyltransferase